MTSDSFQDAHSLFQLLEFGVPQGMQCTICVSYADGFHDMRSQFDLTSNNAHNELTLNTLLVIRLHVLTHELQLYIVAQTNDTDYIYIRTFPVNFSEVGSLTTTIWFYDIVICHCWFTVHSMCRLHLARLHDIVYACLSTSLNAPNWHSF
mgnify:CR=1 FL=1